MTAPVKEGVVGSGPAEETTPRPMSMNPSSLLPNPQAARFEAPILRLTMTNENDRLTFDLDRQGVQPFIPLLRSGFTWPFERGRSLREILLEAGIPEEAIESRLQTVFINGSPVDSLDDPVFGPEARLALSAAMPGLFGASMRRAGYYAGLRESISCLAAGRAGSSESGLQGRLFIRLLNFTATEMGPYFLCRGVGLQAGQLAELLSELPAGFWSACKTARAGGVQIEAKPRALQEWLAGRSEVVLQVRGG